MCAGIGYYILPMLKHGNAKQTIYNVDYCAILSKNPLLEFHIEQKLWSSLFASNDNKSNVREIKAQLLMFRVRIGRKDIR